MIVPPYKTTNLSEAAYLLSKSTIQFVGLEPRDQRSYYFCFTPSERCQKLALEFVSGKGVVRARSYADAMKRAKDLVFSRERGNGLAST